MIFILDSLLEGLPVDTSPIGELRDGTANNEEENRIRAELESDPERLSAALRKYSKRKHIPLLIEAYGSPNEANSKSKNMQPVLLNAQMMEKITAKCRSIGVTINACFTAAFNVATMEVAREGGLDRDVYDITTKHPVDTRRLMKDLRTLPLGFHVISFTHCTSTPRNVKNFWPYVQHLGTELRQKLKNNYMCEERVLETLTRPEGFTHDAKCVNQLPDCDFIITNLYDPKSSPTHGIGKNIQVTATRYVSGLHNASHRIGVGLFSTRDQIGLQFVYATGDIHSKVANMWVEKGVAMLHDVSRMVD